MLINNQSLLLFTFTAVAKKISSCFLTLYLLTYIAVFCVFLMHQSRCCPGGGGGQPTGFWQMDKWNVRNPLPRQTKIVRILWVACGSGIFWQCFFYCLRIPQPLGWGRCQLSHPRQWPCVRNLRIAPSPKGQHLDWCISWEHHIYVNKAAWDSL